MDIEAVRVLNRLTEDSSRRPDPGLSGSVDRSFYGAALDARKHALAGCAGTGYLSVR